MKNCANINKSRKLTDAQDWETFVSKYEDIAKRFVEGYPHVEDWKEFARSPKNLTKERIVLKR